ncbi:hypothetical protein D1007_16857 [Hordeum vulgare]|nr:hypothetical protein D1007_16857 [Hordeum vulgare]
MARRGIQLNKGNIVGLWLDDLGDNFLLKDKYPELFEICMDKECTADKMENTNHLSPFRRRLSSEMLQKWDEMRRYVLDKIDKDKDDEIYWKLDNSREYSTKSMYRPAKTCDDGGGQKGAEVLKENASQMLLLCWPPTPETPEQADEEEACEKW